MVRNFATFKCDLEDAPTWDDDGNVVTPGGRRILDVIRGKLTELGRDCTECKQRSFYGWMFEVESDFGTQMVIIQYPEPWLLTVERKPGFWGSLLGKVDPRIDPQLIDDIAGILEENNRFQDIEWYSRDEYSREGAPGNPE